MINRRRKSLITGGAGFLGSHLCERLLKEGHEVICVDNFITGSEKNIAPLLTHPHFSFIQHDVCNALYIEVDEIYNLASLASPAHYQKDPIKTLRTNVQGALNMLELARRNQATFLQASTSEVYGDPCVHPQKENYWGNVNPIGPRACYDESKRCAETLCFDYHRQYHLSIKVVRIFNTYGPRMQLEDGRVVSNLIRQALKKEPLTIYGDGSQTRSFCYVEDMIEGFCKMMHTDGWVTGPVNLGNPEECSILQLAKHILKVTKSPSSLSFAKLPLDDPKKRRPVIEAAKQFLGWAPKVCLEEGLQKTAAYFERLLLLSYKQPEEEDAFLSL